MSTEKTVITVTATVNAPVSKVWEYWNTPAHITKWAFASPDWHTPTASNDLRAGGSFSSRMEAKDGSMGFDFGGIYDAVEENNYIGYTLGDQRKVKITFIADGDSTHISESFDAEEQNPVEMQQMGWQAILDNFKNYTEGN
ncbi:SRPBCC family protein [Ferruginibacter sp. HRS2-29]|uniref:SRPBCC family protein n=1 Tax=Ferruginibacter sp. HRS2-29 TaxID=2487334 RepID=UPI0020CE50DE|nr:SRPBCC family protein [Ferruginibacter sp. HRS2-29]MCP9750945.1 polyketide cyclase [Ferruginibacter sp. HRS2-29]